MQKRKLHAEDQLAPPEDDEDDMFSDNFQPGKLQKSQHIPATADGLRKDSMPLLSEQYDDLDGYYKVSADDLIFDGSVGADKSPVEYRVSAVLGKGVFATVVRAQRTLTGHDVKDTADVKDDDSAHVAIKILRNNDVMLKSGRKELAMLKKIDALQRPESRNVIKFLSSFEYRGHLCIVFEAMRQNLRELLYKYGKNKGLNIKAIRIYGRQLVGALCALRQCSILHADIKPDNILINEDNTKIKLADLGSACEVGGNDITPYLVSRFYRAPEIILGAPYEYGIDIWSVACTLYELYTGSILFAGKSNNQMLKFMMQTKGRFPTKLLKRSQFASQHFELLDATVLFIDKHPDNSNSSNSEYVKKYLPEVRPSNDFKHRLLSPAERAKITDADILQLVHDFVDFLENCFILNPDKRINCFDAFNHRFLKLPTK